MTKDHPIAKTEQLPDPSRRNLALALLGGLTGALILEGCDEPEQRLESEGERPDLSGTIEQLSIGVLTVAQLSSSVGNDGDLAFVLGYYANGDGGGGAFYWDSASTETANGGTTFGTATSGRWKRLYSQPVRPRWFGAKGDGTTDDTAALTAMFSSGATNFDLGVGTYKVSVSGRAFLATFTSVSHVVVNGAGAVISDARTYASDLSGIFKFVGCSDVNVAVNYVGQTRVLSNSGLEDTGAVVVGFYNACQRARVTGSLREARYGVHSGSYLDDADFRGGCRDIEVDIHAENTGYPVAFYLADAVDLKVDCNTVGRAVYLAGTNSATAAVRFANIYSPVAVIITDAKDSAGTVHGSSNMRISSTDTGSTYTSLDSWAAGISGSWSDPNVRYEDIDIHVNVRSSNGVATSMGGVIINNIPGWNASNVVRNIRISGLIDRSLQTAGGTNAVGDIYIYAGDTSAPIMDNISIENFSLKKGTAGFSAAWPISLLVQGLVGNLNVVNCDFSQARLLFNPGTGAAQVASAALRVVNSSLLELGNPGYAPNVSLLNSTILTAAAGGIEGARDVANSVITGSSKQARVKTIDVALSGPSIVLTAAIPSGYLDGVCGIITSAVTGSVGYMVGTATEPSLFVETLNNAVGAAFSPVNSNPAFTGAVFSAVASDLVITNRTGAFSGGSLRLFVHYTVITPPTL